MSDSNRVSLRYVEEATYGAVPSASGTAAMQDLRFLSEGFKQTTAMEESAEIRSDRQIADVKRTDINAEGPLAFELSYDSFDDFLAAALLSAGWSSTASADGTDLSFDNASAEIRSTTDDDFASFSANQWIEVKDSTSNDGYYKISSVTDLNLGGGEENNVLVVTHGTITDEAAGEDITITMGAQIVNGTTSTSYTIEKEFKDLTQEFAYYTGMMIDTMNLNFAAAELITGDFGFIGVKETSNTVTQTYSTASAVNSNPIMSGVDDVSYMYEAAASKATNSVSLSLGNNLRRRTNLATLGTVSIGKGSISLSGSMEAYFASKTLLDKYLAETATQLSLVLQDSDGNGYIIDMPQVRISDGSRVADGKDGDVIEKINWTAYRDSSEDITIRIAKFAA